MPKAEKLSTKRSAVLARERREREKENNEYNATLKEFLQFKYSHIIAEFHPFYENLKTNHPANMIYTNTNEFRLWRKREIEKTFSPSNGREQQDEQLGEQQQDEQLGEQQQDEQLGEQQQQDEQLGEQQQDEQLGEQQQQDEQLGEQQQDERLGEQQQDERLGEQQQDEQLGEQQQDEQLVGELGRLVDEIVGDHNDDEGIALDLWEELQGDIELFDYQLEVELEEYM